MFMIIIIKIYILCHPKALSLPLRAASAQNPSKTTSHWVQKIPGHAGRLQPFGMLYGTNVF